jgi:membrane protease YdiL (CAAX protease family)
MALWQRETSRSSRAGERRDPLAAVRRHPIITFFVLAFVISWGFLPFEAVRFLPSGPLLAALIVAPLTQGWAGLRDLGRRIIRWRLRWYWYALAIGLPLAVHLINVVLNVALGTPAPSLAQFSPVYTILVVFAVRLVNPADGPLGEEPGWRGFAQPRLQAERSPLLATLILAVLVTVWHVPTFILEAGLQPSFILGGVLATLAVTFWYAWLFNRTGGSVLMTLIAHATEGSIQVGALWPAGAAGRLILVYAGVWCVVAIGLVVLDWRFWRGPAPAPATVQAAYEGESRVR